MGITDLLGKMRAWIDGEEAEAATDRQKKRGVSKWEEFMIAIARGVEEVMEEEMFTPPGGPTYIPREYLIFLSKDDDARWQGEKRHGLERGLHAALAERARELVQPGGSLQTASIAIELRVDPGLEAGKFRIQAVWDATPEATKVLPRPAERSGAITPPPSLAAPRSDEPQLFFEESPTVVKPRAAAPRPDDADDDATVVRPRAPLFRIRVVRDGECLAVHPIFKSAVTIGRGAQEDVRVEGDMEVSRSHVRLERSEDGTISATCLGRNSIYVGGREVLTDAQTAVSLGDEIRLCAFTLRIEAPEA